MSNWLAANAPRGTIANWSHVLEGTSCSDHKFSTSLENAIIAAHDAGIIVVVCAGNDGCNTADYSPTRIPQAFVVGATNNSRLSYGQDAKTYFSRTGWNISTFAPGENVALLDQDGSPTVGSGTSFAAPYVAGIFATACQAVAPYCSTTATSTVYQALRDTGYLGTVTNPDGTTLTGATSRFIWKQAW